jgi:hypothetical protein
MSRPNPSSVAPAARIIATYDHDVEGAAEALLALLQRPGQRGQPANPTDPFVDETEAM